MKILDRDVGKTTDDGEIWISAIVAWFVDPSFDLSTLSVKHADTLKRFEAIAICAGCTNYKQVEYIYQLEKRVNKIEEVMNRDSYRNRIQCDRAAPERRA